MQPNAALPPDSRFTPAPGIIETDLGSELILLDPTTQEMFSLNPTGRLVWQALADAPLDRVVDRVVAAFEVDAAVAAADVSELVRRLRAAGLLLEAS